MLDSTSLSSNSPLPSALRSSFVLRGIVGAMIIIAALSVLERRPPPRRARPRGRDLA